MAIIKNWMAYTREAAVRAVSDRRATKMLSTMLYSALTSMEATMGNAMLVSSGNTGFSFIKVSFIRVHSFFCTKIA